MNREQKQQEIEDLVALIQSKPNFCIADISGLDVAKNNDLRRIAFQKDIKIRATKNTILKLALEQLDTDYSDIYPALKTSTALFLSESINAGARLIKDFSAKGGYPKLKGAYLQQNPYVGGPEILDTLASLKSREELVADIIAALQAPIRNVISALQNEERGLSTEASVQEDQPTSNTNEADAGTTEPTAEA